MRFRLRVLTVLAAVFAMLAVAAPAQAIKNGVPDAGAHPYVGQLLFFDPTATDPRFSDPGGWFNCSGTLVSPTILVTAGHCTFPEGTNGSPTPGNSGGNDVWVSFAEVPDYSILPPSSTFAPDNNEGRYDAWSTALNASTEWIRGTAFPHPQYDDNQFFLHDLGVVRLSKPVKLSEYGQLPTLNLLDELYAANKQQLYTAVGYGLEGSGPKTSFGGDTRRRADLRLVNLNGVLGLGKGTSAKFSNNANTGGTCFGDSGGPFFVAGTTTLVAVNSFGTSETCSGTSGAYRIDQADDLAFLATFGLTPAA
jgi:trypsin